MLRCGWAGFAAQRNKSVFLFGWRCAYENNADRDASIQFGHFCNTKGKREHRITLAFVASRRACRPTAIFSIQLAGSYTRPASRGTRRATAVKPRPSRMSLYVPQRPMGAMWGQGALPLVRAMRPVAEWRSSIQLTRNPHQTGEPRGLSPSGGKPPRPSRMSLYAPARLCRAVRGQGVLPLVNGGNGGMLAGV